ncbi:hypothetical protein L228DRAFT_141247 [Xylona heveae TC161]|uniref:Uncharacterized protein n=1 Tax=Xylona heveae (strain CBS 132557 / TC161) TaxID=1328760 RepID=A0A165H5B3_XYLHT|nr:hypothetical protein L228DRAFT_141247 [Xylona heveae TC161]KZF23005.1 hypothetical protein L228DRAFT_141247 [Xylona heveae TC161]
MGESLNPLPRDSDTWLREASLSARIWTLWTGYVDLQSQIIFCFIILPGGCLSFLSCITKRCLVSCIRWRIVPVANVRSCKYIYNTLQPGCPFVRLTVKSKLGVRTFHHHHHHHHRNVYGIRYTVYGISIIFY